MFYRHLGPSEKVEVLFKFISSIVVCVSGVFTFHGLLTIYDVADNSKLVLFSALVVSFVLIITFFWNIIFSYLIALPSNEKNVKKRLSPIISAPYLQPKSKDKFLFLFFIFFVLILIFFSSTYFNIISLSGRPITQREIQNNINELTSDILSINQLRIRMLKETNSVLARAGDKYLTFADEEAEFDKVMNVLNSDGTMTSTYKNLDGNIQSILTPIQDEIETINDSDETSQNGINGIRDKIKKLQMSIGSAAVLESGSSSFNDWLSKVNIYNQTVISCIYKQEIETKKKILSMDF